MDIATILLPLLRGAHLAALLSLFGTLLFAVVVVPADWRAAATQADPLQAALTRAARLSLYLALALGAAWFAALPGMAFGARFEQVLGLRLVLLLATLKLLPRTPAVAVVAAGLALALQPALGHAWALAGGVGVMLIGSEALHLLAAGVWLGGLLSLLVCSARLPPSQSAQVCRRFAPLGLASAGIIAITAALQGGQLVGSVPALIGTHYGRTALLVLGLFSAALLLAALNRRRFTPGPAGGDPIVAQRRLRLSIGAEAAIGLAIVLAAGFLASLPPAAKQQPLWPFAWRLSFAEMDDPAIRIRVALALVAAGVGVASAVLGLLWRRARTALVAFGACLLVAATPTVRLLLVEAYPTSYYRSPTGFAAASIMHGKQIFEANCVICHGAEGRGDGPLAGQLPLRPADLTAAHLLGHSDGELFWWVSNGRQTIDGNPVMPAFAPILSDADRWSVIDFVRANNAGIGERTAGAWVVPIAAPALPVVCAGLPADEMQELRGSVVRVVADGDEEGSQPPSACSPTGRLQHSDTAP